MGIYNTSTNKESFSFQKIVVIVGVILFVLKVIAWYLTRSVSILSDALESTINVVAGFFALYSIYLSAQPKDRNHPYGHGKIEYISAGVEGVLITCAGLIIIYTTIQNIVNKPEIGKLDYGILLIGITAIMNFLLGHIAEIKGRKNNSLAMVATGKHLKSDTYSTIGVIVGLIVIKFTNFYWLDNVIAIIMGGVIIYTGAKIIRESYAGIMDEADESLIQELVDVLEENRKDNWIDIHNVRFIKYGNSLHLDGHITMPWYFNLKESHEELDDFKKVVVNNFGDSFEMFIHIDGCEPYSCKICQKKDCKVRLEQFQKKITWTRENIAKDRKHRIQGEGL